MEEAAVYVKANDLMLAGVICGIVMAALFLVAFICFDGLQSRLEARKRAKQYSEERPVEREWRGNERRSQRTERIERIEREPEAKEYYEEPRPGTVQRVARMQVPEEPLQRPMRGTRSTQRRELPTDLPRDAGEGDF